MKEAAMRALRAVLEHSFRLDRIGRASSIVFIGSIAATLIACSAMHSSETQSALKADGTSSKDDGDAVTGERAASVASMPRAKTESMLGLPTDLLGNGNLSRAFIKRRSGAHAKVSPDIVGIFSTASCVEGTTFETPISEDDSKGFNPIPYDKSTSPSEILGFDINANSREASMETDFANFLKGDENTDLVFYNPASFLRGVRSLRGVHLGPFVSDRCGSLYVKKVAYVGRIFVVLKVTYRSPQDRKTVEERLRASKLELASLLTEIKRDPGTYRSLLKFSMAAYQIGGDVRKLAANLGGASYVECTPDDLIACEGVYKNLTEYATDSHAGFPSQLTPRSEPGPVAVPVGFGDMSDLPRLSQLETVL